MIVDINLQNKWV